MVFLYASQTIPLYALLALAVEERCGFATLPKICRLAGGKPVFEKYPKLHFSGSHSGHLSLCAVGDGAVGVDIEGVRPRRAGLAQYALTPLEYARYVRLGGAWGDFYTQWTRREAWSKYTGKGVAASRGLEIPEGLVLRSFEDENWRAAVCSAGPVGAITWR